MSFSREEVEEEFASFENERRFRVEAWAEGAYARRLEGLRVYNKWRRASASVKAANRSRKRRHERTTDARLRQSRSCLAWCSACGVFHDIRKHAMKICAECGGAATYAVMPPVRDVGAGNHYEGSVVYLCETDARAKEMGGPGLPVGRVRRLPGVPPSEGR